MSLLPKAPRLVRVRVRVRVGLLPRAPHLVQGREGVRGLDEDEVPAVVEAEDEGYGMGIPG